MGKGDQRSRRGKIWRGTFGKRRPKTTTHAKGGGAMPPEPDKKPAKKDEASA